MLYLDVTWKILNSVISILQEKIMVHNRLDEVEIWARNYLSYYFDTSTLNLEVYKSTSHQKINFNFVFSCETPLPCSATQPEALADALVYQLTSAIQNSPAFASISSENKKAIQTLEDRIKTLQNENMKLLNTIKDALLSGECTIQCNNKEE